MAWTKQHLVEFEQPCKLICVNGTAELLLCVFPGAQSPAYLWSRPERKVVAQTPAPVGDIEAATLSSDGQMAVFAGASICLWNRAQPDRLMRSHQPELARLSSSDLAFLPNSHTLVAADRHTGRVSCIDLDTWQLSATLGQWAGVAGPLVSPNGRWLALAFRQQDHLLVIDLQEAGPPLEIETHSYLSAGTYAFVGLLDQLAVMTTHRQLLIWDLPQQQLLRYVRTRTPLRDMAFNADGTQLLCTYEGETSVYTATGHFIQTLSDSDYVWDLVSHPSTNTVFVALTDGLHAWSPTATATAPARDDRLGQLMKAKDWVRTAALNLRAAGYFANLAAWSDAKFVKWIKAECDCEGEPLSSLSLFWLLALDKERVWWQDLECVENGDEYTAALQTWSAISQGAFQPSDIVEVQDRTRDTFTVSFKIGEALYELHPENDTDWMDLMILRALNEIIAPTGRQFAVFSEPHDQTAAVICLTNEEKDKLTREWGFRFQDRWLTGDQQCT